MESQKNSSLTRSGSSKFQNLVEKGQVRPESFKRFVNPHRDLRHEPTRMTMSHQNSTSYENIDTFYMDSEIMESESRRDLKLFPKCTSTTELRNNNCGNSVFRSTSSIGSSNFSGSDLLSNSNHSSTNGIYVNLPYSKPHASGQMTTSFVGPDNFTSSPTTPRNRRDSACGSSSMTEGGQRRNSRFSEYISSTSSWEWEDDEYPNNIPILTDTRFVFPERNLISFHDHQGQPASDSSTTTTIQNEMPSTSTSLAASGISSASCPSLNTMDSVRRHSVEFKTKLRQGFGLDRMDEASASTTEIDSKSKGPSLSSKVKGKGKLRPGIGSSKSSGCIWAADSPCSQSHLKRPVTLRFTPSGLQQSSRVVWCSETGDHSGIVQWVGTIREQYYAGVEFEKPVGNSSGIHGYGHGLQMRLFTCKLGYGRFVPVEQLILYEDFYESQKTGFICIICRDDFIEPGSSEQGFDIPENFMCATKCGHLFHQRCLNSWFNEKAVSFQHCPYCQIPMDRNDTIRIFPAQLK